MGEERESKIIDQRGHTFRLAIYFGMQGGKSGQGGQGAPAEVSPRIWSSLFSGRQLSPWNWSISS